MFFVNLWLEKTGDRWPGEFNVEELRGQIQVGTVPMGQRLGNIKEEYEKPRQFSHWSPASQFRTVTV